MNSIFFTPKYETHGNRIFGLVKARFPEESTRLFHTIPALKAGLKSVHSRGVVIVIVDGEDDLVELALKPGIPQNLAIVVVLPDRNEGLLRVASALGPALIWFDDNSVDDLMSIISRIKLEQNIRREELENLELSWSDDHPHATNFFWYSMKSYSRRIQSLPEIAYYA
jgi:hypothetical protein